MPVCCRSNCRTLSEYKASRRLLRVFRSNAERAELRKNVTPQLASEGSTRRRSCSAESEFPSEPSNVRQQPGVFQGSDMLGVSSEPLAKLVSRAAPSARSITVIACPWRLRTYAQVRPISPLPITTTFIFPPGRRVRWTDLASPPPSLFGVSRRAEY